MVQAAALVLALVGAAVTGYLVVETGSSSGPACLVGHGCDVVANSAQAHIGRVPTAALGMLFYLLLAAAFAVRLAARPPEDVARLFMAGSALALAVATGFTAWLTYVELFDLHAFCTWCTVSAVDIVLLDALAVVDFIGARRAAGEPDDEEYKDGGEPG